MPSTELALLESAHRFGVLSNASLEALKRAVHSRRIILGSPVDNYQQNRVHLVANLFDDSDSLNVVVRRNPETRQVRSVSVSSDDPKSNSEAVRVGGNSVLDSLEESDGAESIWYSSRYFKGDDLTPWGPLSGAKRLTRENFRPRGSTPLYDATVATLGSVMAKLMEFRTIKRTRVRTATLITTDGEDSSSTLQNPDSVRSLVADMNNMGIHIIAAMGVDDGHTDFRKVFLNMGIQENLILTPGSTPEEIRKAFGLFGKMASRAVDPHQFTLLRSDGFLALPPGGR